MSLVRKMQEEAKTPTLYTMYGKQYDFDELQRSADQGLAEHLAGLKRGSKDETQFRDAYNNIMMGIKDGSITYQDGRFVDTKYGYHNSPDKDKNKDHYGLMANYIFGKMGKSPEYVKPEDKTKIKWNGAESVGLALRRALYNSDNENIAAFLDIDKNDLKSTKERASRLHTALTNVLSNFDNLFTGYSDVDKASYTGNAGYITEALKALEDKSFDAGDYLALSRAASGLNYNGMFAGAVPLQLKNSTGRSGQSSGSGNTETEVELFLKFMDEHYPQHTFTNLGSIFDYSAASKIQLTPEVQAAFNLALSSMSDEQLLDILGRYIRTPKEASPFQIKLGDTVTPISNAAATAYILKYLKDNGKLSTYNFGESDLGSYYLPGSWKKGGASGLVWDTTTGKVSEMDYLKIPYLRLQIAQEFRNWLKARSSGNTGTSHWLDSYGFYKEGGIIKASTGTKFDNILDAITYTADDLSDARRFRNLFQNGLINNMTLRGDIAATDETAKYNRAYDPEPGGKETEALDWWNSWVQLLTSREDLAEAWAKRYLALNKTTDKNNNLVHGQNWFNPDGTFNFKNFLQTVSPASLKAYWLDLNNGIGHDFYRGRAYQIEGQDGYYQGLLDGYELVGDPKLDSGNLAYVYTMRRKALSTLNNSYPDGVDEPYDGSDFDESTGIVTPVPKTQTKITPVIGDKGKSGGTGQGFLSTLGNLAPELIGAGRLALSLNTNNRVAKTIRPSLTPVLKNTYERFSPITGDWYTRQSGYKRAEDIRSRFSRPITSDASLYVRTMLEANRQATALQSQADAADNQEIKRTAAEALARVEDNMARRSETANFNRASMNQTNREIAQLEATRLKSNWQSWDNYLQGIESRQRAKQQERDALRNSAMQAALGTQYSDVIAKLDALYREQNPNATISTMLVDSRYTDAVRALLRLHLYNSYNFSINSREDPYKGYKPRSYDDILGSLKFSAKSGGLLKPSAAYLINKVIRNESNT